ncbi:hypothetical protein RvY_01038 [Ramazzottius varieornatus]|uniref:Uncharacterized protein n=1 Tax=Ramazzottius varieornatus TaxID=947166 RepID=A0A1D1UII7_RAMVA|nr:hypothetical protein RvY_01038 [Ramazzottius varieornatus]
MEVQVEATLARSSGRYDLVKSLVDRGERPVYGDVLPINAASWLTLHWLAVVNFTKFAVRVHSTYRKTLDIT